ncbi:MAG: PadR family transcriptional regulator [Peptococcaceae bacterium]|nr:PadR family transcriptional regulator [Peptococcaceae bacterium]
MSLSYAILGILSYRPMTGYNLKEVFDNAICHFWHAHLSQIYRDLSRMEEEGLVRSEVQRREGRPDRKVYHITPEGLERFQSWLESFPPNLAVRYNDEFLLRLYFGGRIGREEVLYQVTKYKKETEEKLMRFRSLFRVIEDFAQKAGGPQDRLYWEMTLDLGIRLVKAHLEWITDVMDKIKKNVPD